MGIQNGMATLEDSMVSYKIQFKIDALNCGVGEDSCESLGLQGDPTSPF